MKNPEGTDQKKRGGLRYWFRHFDEKHRVSVRSRRENEEVWHFYISPLRATLAALGLLIVLFAVVVTAVVYTPVLDKLPGYPGRQARALLMENLDRLDSMEQDVRIMQRYANDVSLILAGEVPPVSVGRSVDTMTHDWALVPPSAADSLLRAQLEGPGRYALNVAGAEAGGEAVSRREFASPVRGRITETFDPLHGMYGVEVEPDGAQQVLAVLAGTVVVDQWTPSDGNVIAIQHADGYLSCYKHVGESLRRTGDRVQAGEALGYIGSESDPHAGEDFVFELWIDGAPADPQNYIIFQ